MPNKDLDLIKRYAPILWVARGDAFVPEDARIMEQIARVGSSKNNMRPFQLDQLGNLQNSERCYMDIPGVDFANFGTGPGYAGQEPGPEGVSSYMEKKYGNNPVLDPNARQITPIYYGRVSNVGIYPRANEPFTVSFNQHDPGVFGDYHVIQYFFFYLYNEAWNKHIGDWDSTLELLIKSDNSRGYAIMHMHHLTWMASFGGGQRKLKPWIKEWPKAEGKKMGPMFHLAAHPFVFIARGAHGGYPTPGFSIHGIGALGKNMIGQTDFRQIGNLCILPEYPPITRSWVLDTLREAGITTGQTRFLPWGEPVVLTNQTWLKYKGLWGERTKYGGWSGPTGPAQKSFWHITQRRIKSSLAKAVKGNYKGGPILKIITNWHGWPGMA